MNNIKYQNYSHYKLPITMDPLKYGKLIEQIGNKYIITLTTPTNIAVIKHINNENFVRIFRKGELIFEYKEIKISDIKFIRIISDQKFTFENNKLIATEILNASGSVIIFNSNNINPLNSPLVTQFNYKTSLIKWLENTYIFKHKKAELFILFELFLIFLVYIIFFVIFPDVNEDSPTISLAAYNVFKMRKVASKYNWNESVINVNSKIFTKNLLENIMNKFWNEIESKFTGNNHMFILFKIKYINGEYSSIGKVQRLNKSDYSWYIDFIIESMKFKSEYYNETQIDSLILSYGFKEGKIKNKEDININIKFIKINETNLPISINPLDFGRLTKTINIENGELLIIQNKKGEIIMFSKFNSYNEVEILKDGILLLKFKDEILSENRFIRIIDNKKYYFEDGQQYLYVKDLKGKFIAKTKKTKKIIDNFITLDIETYKDGNTLIPYIISFYNGKFCKSFWLKDYENVEQMILDCLKSIMIRKYNGYKVYVHNLAKFDIIFLLKYLVKIGSVQPIIHKDRIISLGVNYGNNNEYQIQFKDSYLLLLHSLRKLTQAFMVVNPKSIFPHFFIDKNNLDYIGKIPDIKYFDNISKNDYNNYKTNFKSWNLKNEAIKYCEIDCISLYQVVYKFNNMIFDLFGKNIHHYPTLPSLAFAVFRSNFMEEENIPQLSGQIANDIRQGYTGGAVDMYIPKFDNTNNQEIKMKCLDVNSLYPFSMHNKLLPVGIPTFFKGNIRLIDPNAFGFFYCKIVAPDNILHPILQTHVNTNNGIRTIAAIGNWEDMLFSEELYNAEKYGYKITIIWGYTFESKNVFENYVDFLYNLRLNYPKSDPLNFIAKILMNSLYGRFGMDDNFANITVIHKDFYGDFENKHFDDIIDKIKLDDYWLVIFKIPIQVEDIGTHNVSISIAAAITAYSRIYMSQFKNNHKIKLYYTDTDSIYTDSNIDDSFIDEKILGKLKVENICNKAIFLTPKVYCLITESGETIYKVKGLSHDINLTFEDFEKLLTKDVLIEKTQSKWFRKLSEGKINILDELYTLKVNDNKRFLIYKNNKLIGTKAYKIDNSKNIKTSNLPISKK